MTAAIITKERCWWVEGHLRSRTKDVWHPLYGPMVEHEARRIRNHFLVAADERLELYDPSLIEYDDYRVREHRESPDRRSRDALKAAAAAEKNWAIADQAPRYRKGKSLQASASQVPVSKPESSGAKSANEVRIRVKIKKRKRTHS